MIRAIVEGPEFVSPRSGKVWPGFRHYIVQHANGGNVACLGTEEGQRRVALIKSVRFVPYSPENWAAANPQPELAL